MWPSSPCPLPHNTHCYAPSSALYFHSFPLFPALPPFMHTHQHSPGLIHTGIPVHSWNTALHYSYLITVCPHSPLVTLLLPHSIPTQTNLTWFIYSHSTMYASPSPVILPCVPPFFPLCPILPPFTPTFPLNSPLFTDTVAHKPSFFH